jgi:F-type H+-transporting ATPase subunit b
MLIRIAFGGLLVVALLASQPAVAAEHAAASQPAAAESAAGEPHEGGHDATPNPLSWSNELAIWTGVVFVILFAVLWRYAWGPIVDGLTKREQRVADQIAQAEHANQQAKDTLAQYELRLAQAADDVRKLVDEGRRQAEQTGRELIDKAKAEAQAEQQRALRQIDAATTSALKELADRSAELAVDLAGKIVHAKLNARDHAQLIEEAVAGFAGKRA